MRRKIPPVPPFVRHPETEALIGILRLMERGERRAYEALTREVGFDVRRPRHYLAAARKMLGPEGYVFHCLPNWGVERLDDAATVAHAGDRVSKRARRQARRGLGELGTVRLEKLDRDGLILVNALIAQGGAVLAVTGRGAQRRLVLAQGSEPRRLSAGEFVDATRDLFRRRITDQ